MPHSTKRRVNEIINSFCDFLCFIQTKLKRQICATNSENEMRKAQNYSLPDLAVSAESTALAAAQFDQSGAVL